MTARWRALGWRIGLLLLLGAGGSGAGAEVRAVVISGLGGTPDYAERFDRNATDIAAAMSSLSADDQAVQRLTSPRRDALLEAIQAAAAVEGELFALVLIGHGTTDARGWRFNLPGEDLDDASLVAALANVRAARQLVVVASSASGALLETLSQPGRLLVTATKSGGEVNAVRFGRHFAQALRDGAADLDRNEIVTLAEAWRYTVAEVAAWYERENLLASENPRLSGEGADTLALARLGALADAADDPVVAALLERRERLQVEFAALRDDKPDREIAAYYSALEQVLLRIARLQLEIDEATGWSESDADS